jgi:hypothetical protein
MGATVWVENYKRAWASNEPDDIRALFTTDAIYAYRPNDAKAPRGHDAIVASWLEGRDSPGDYAFEFWVVSEGPKVAVVQAVTDYSASGGNVYDNLWVIHFADDGRASEFTEWYMARD